MSVELSAADRARLVETAHGIARTVGGNLPDLEAYRAALSRLCASLEPGWPPYLGGPAAEACLGALQMGIERAHGTVQEPPTRALLRSLLGLAVALSAAELDEEAWLLLERVRLRLHHWPSEPNPEQAVELRDELLLELAKSAYSLGISRARVDELSGFVERVLQSMELGGEPGRSALSALRLLLARSWAEDGQTQKALDELSRLSSEAEPTLRGRVELNRASVLAGAGESREALALIDELLGGLAQQDPSLRAKLLILRAALLTRSIAEERDAGLE